MLRNRVCLGVVLAGVVCLTGTLSRPVSAETVTVNVVQVVASNEGEEYVDPALGALGRRLKRTYPYRSYRKGGSSTQSGAAGGTLQFALQGGMALTLDIKACKDMVVSMLAVVTGGRKRLLSTTLSVGNGRTVIIGVPLGKGRLILAVTPYVK